MGDQAEQARDKEERLESWMDGVLQRVGHLPCSLASRANLVPDPDVPGETVVRCGCGEFFSPPRAGVPATRDDLPDSQDAGPAASEVTTGHALSPLARMVEQVDATRIYTPEELERQILDVVRRIDAGTLYESELIGAAYSTAQAYELASAKALIRADGGAAKDRQAWALAECEEEFNAMTQAEMMKKVVAAAMHNLRAQLSGLQSVLRSVGASYNTGGSPGSNKAF
jgi:hypothetical protein